MATSQVRRVAVVGGGVAGLAAAEAILEASPSLDVRLFERSTRLGGLVETEQTEDGFCIEYGADCLLTSRSASIDALRRAGLTQRVVMPLAEARKSYVLRGGELAPLPAGMLFGAPTNARALFAQSALSGTTKLRMLCEPFMRRGAHDGDESVAAFITRRFGKGFLDQLVSPLLESVHGASVERLSAQACLPQPFELERIYGSVGRHFRKLASGAPLPAVSLDDGMETLVRAMAAPHLSKTVRGAEVRRIDALADGRYRLSLSGEGYYEADGVVVAAPAYAAVPMLAALAPNLATLLASIPYTRLDSVTLAFPRRALRQQPSGSGFVVPASEQKRLRACTWLSAKWPRRAAPEFVLLRAVLAGDDLGGPELVAHAQRELGELFGISEPPALVRLRRRPRALPIQDVHCLVRRENMHAAARALPAFALAGTALGLVGVPSCIDSGRSAGLEVASALMQSMQARRVALVAVERAPNVTPQREGDRSARGALHLSRD